MIRSPRALSSLLVAVALAAPIAVHGAAQTKRPGRPVAAKPIAADNSIIALPLTPTVPATRRLCANRTPSGLGYTVLRAATGAKPPANATALVNYIGYLDATGTVFDQGMRTPLPIGEVIPGFSQGMQLIGKGGIIRLCIPAALGYGAQSTGPIPANADLVFQVELMDFKTQAEISDLRKTEAETPAPPSSTHP